MESMSESQITHLFVGSILSWKGTDGQCLAALHTHISALEPDQADSTLLEEKTFQARGVRSRSHV